MTASTFYIVVLYAGIHLYLADSVYYSVSMARLRTVRKNQIILYQGEAITNVHIVRKGIVRAYSILSNGNEVIVAMFGPNDYFPVGALYGAAPASLFYYETMSDGQIESMTLPEFVDYISQDKDEMARGSRRYMGALLHVNALGQATAAEQLAYTLRYLVLRFGVPLQGRVFTRIDIKLTQQDIARLCNVSRETASIELKKLKARNVITERGKLYSVNMGLLNKLLGEDSPTEFTP